MSYRCGIKTCSRCRQFEFRVAAKSFCIWDEADFQPFLVESALPRGYDDPLDIQNWKDDSALAPRFINETLLHKAEPRDFPSVLDVGGSDHVVKMDRRRVKMANSHHDGQPAKASALDDDEDAD